jgi:hypothetical protein
MKFLSVIIFVGTFFIFSPARAQNLADAKTYVEVIDKQHSKIAEDMLAYNNAVAQNKKTDKITELSKGLLAEINKSELTISAMPPFQEDKEFRDSAVFFMKTCFNLLSTDYTAIAAAQADAAKSYDKMKTQLTAKLAAGEKLKTANVAYHRSFMKFSDKYIYSLDGFSAKTQQAQDVNTYYNKIYLLFFKTYNAESYLLDAIKKNDGNSVAQNKKIVNQNAQDGLKQLDTAKAFNGDNNLVKKCQEILTFYSEETDEKMDNISGYFPATKDFQKTRADYERKSTHTKDEVNAYKKAVDQYNKVLSTFNKTTGKLNHAREKEVNKWNDGVASFLHKHLP